MTLKHGSGVTDFGTNEKRVYTFLLVINSNFSPILRTVLEIWRFKGRKSPILPTLPSFNAPLWGTPQNFGMKLALEKLEDGATVW